MGQFFQIILRLLVFRDTPASLPGSLQVFFGLVAVYVVWLPLYLHVLVPGEFNIAIVYLVTALDYALLSLLLTLTGRPARIPQTLAAIVGADLLLGILLVSLCVLVLPLSKTLFAMAYLVVFLWSIAVNGRSLALALEWPTVAGALVVFAVFWVSQHMLFALSPPASATTGMLAPLARVFV